MTAIRPVRPLVVLCACSFVLLACARQEKPTRTPATLAPEPSSASEPGPSPAPPARPKVKTLQSRVGDDPAYLGVLDRKGLLAIIDQGLGRVLARLKLSAVMNRGRFAGFRVTDVDSAWAGAGIETGDVLLRLNGQPIERPEEAQAAFESLRVASEVALEVLRGDEKRSLRFRVE